MAKVNPIQLEKCLKGLDYPTDKENVVKHAEKHGADEDIRSALSQIPDRSYNKPTDISKAIGQIDRQSRGGHAQA